MPLTCVPRQVSSISFPVRVPLDKGNVGNEVFVFRGKKKPTSILFSAWHFSYFRPNVVLSAFYSQPALYLKSAVWINFYPRSGVCSPQSAVRSPQSAVRSPQSSFYTDRYSDIWCDRMFWYLSIVFSDCLPEWFQSKIGMFFDFREWSTIFHNFVSYCSVLLLCS